MRLALALQVTEVAGNADKWRVHTGDSHQDFTNSRKKLKHYSIPSGFSSDSFL